MSVESERKLESQGDLLIIPVAILTKDDEIFVLREKDPEKYTQNEWRFLTGRPWVGEETGQDLVTLALECGFKIEVIEMVESLKGDTSQDFLAGRPVRFDFYYCQVLDGDFSPNIIHPNEYSNYNQYTRYEGKWFKIKKLRSEKYLHHLAINALKFLNKK